MATALPPPGAGGTPTATIGVNLQALQAAPAAAKAAAQATSREIDKAFRESQRAQAAAERQRTAEMKAVLTQRRVAVRVAAREETEVKRAALREQAAAERQHTAQLKAELQQRTNAARAAAAQQRALLRGGATFAGAALGGPVGGIAGALAGGPAALPLAGGLLAGQAAQLAGASIRAASDLTEAINKVGVAFDDSGQRILDWSKNSATALGQSRHDALEAASSFGLLFREMGLGSQRSAEMSERMVELATDMASIHNIRPEDALEKLRAGLIGETRPLRDVGVLLSDQVVRQKAVEMGLASTTAAVNDQQRVLARYQLILEQTSLTQGDFARTITGLANQQRILNAQWEDAQTKIGQLLEFPTSIGAMAMNQWLSTQIAMMDVYTEAIQRAARALHLLPAAPAAQAGSIGSRTGIGAAQREGIPTLQREFTGEQTQLILDRSRMLVNIQRQADRAIVDSASQFAKQRADVIANYEKQIAREAEDFSRQRARAQTKFEQSIVEVMRDSAEKRAEFQEDYEDDVADARAKSNEKLAKLQVDYDRDRERAERSHRNTLLDAASRLDAVAVFQEQRRFAEEKRTRDEDFRDRKKEEQDNLDEQLRERREAFDEQLEEARRNDAKRIADLTSAFEEQQRLEDEDRQLRLDRQAQDHADQLTEMDRAQVERIQQIKDNAAEQRRQYEEQFRLDAVAAGLRIQSWIDEKNRMTDEAIKAFDRFMDEVLKRVTLGGGTTAGQDRGVPVSGGGPILSRASGGPIPRTGLALVHRGEYVLNPATTAAVRNTIGGFDQAGLLAALQGSGGRSVTWNGDVSVSIAGSTNMGSGEMYIVARQAFTDALGEIAAQ